MSDPKASALSKLPPVDTDGGSFGGNSGDGSGSDPPSANSGGDGRIGDNPGSGGGTKGIINGSSGGSSSDPHSSTPRRAVTAKARATTTAHHFKIFLGVSVV